MRLVAANWVVSVFAVCLPLSAASQEAALFAGLGDLRGGDFDSRAADVSADGSVIVGTGNAERGRWAVVWEDDDGSVALDDPILFGAEGPIAILESWAEAVSGDGSVIAGSLRAPELDPFLGAVHPRWENRVPGAIGLDAFGFLFRSTVTGASADGSVLVGYRRVDFNEFAWRWENGTETDLGELGGGLFCSMARDVSEDGAIMVGTRCSVAGPFAFKWQDGITVNLGDLPGGISESDALGISADGSVVVGSSSSELGVEAFRWEGGEMQGLGDLQGGAFSSVATSVSRHGAVVVGNAQSDSGQEAFRWDAAGGMKSLRTLLVDEFELDLGDWVLTEAAAISADGATIVGNGTNPSGFAEAWVAVVPVPEPSPDLLSVSALLALLVIAAHSGGGRRRSSATG